MSWLRRILVIDDELARGDQGSLFASTYPLDGFEYVFAGDEDEAMRLLEQGEEFALILLDLRFEGVGDEHGLEIYDRLVTAGCMAPVVILSSVTRSEAILRAWQRGVHAYVVKWSDNPSFHEELQHVVDSRAFRTNQPAFTSKEQKVIQIRTRAGKLLKSHAGESLSTVIHAARRLKEEIGAEWIHKIPFEQGFENYIRGWNSSELELREADETGAMLYLNMDLGMRCTLNCPHCFTMDGAIDARGRNFVSYSLLKERIVEAKEIGLKAVRILGRGEPTQWIARNRDAEDTGGDFMDFIKFLHENDITPLVFTRGQIIGNDSAAANFYGGTHGVWTGDDLVKALHEMNVSVFLGVSSIFPDVNNEMTGRGKQGDYDPWCRRALSMCIAAGFHRNNPTHLAVESPITTLNIHEMPVRYVLFQALNVSPCMNVYMVTGRVQALGLDNVTDPTQEQFIDIYCTVAYFMRRMGIRGRLGPYAGTKECHDVSNGMYLTLNGDVYPCPGFDNAQSLVGSIRTHSLKKIWENNPLGRRPQSICVPKIASHFPPGFEDQVEELVDRNQSRYESTFREICDGLGLAY